MEGLLNRQQEIIESIKKLEINFGKDSKTRKTGRYLDERLDQLDRLWAEFHNNHEKLEPYRTEDEPYFTAIQYAEAYKYFESVRLRIASYTPSVRSNSPAPGSNPLPAVTVTQPDPAASPRQGASTPSSPNVKQFGASLPSTSKGLGVPIQNDRVAELLSQQRTYFRALERQIKNLKLDKIQEKWELEEELKSLHSRWATIDELHLKIDNILQGSDGLYDDEFYGHEESYKSIRRTLQLKLSSSAHIPNSTPQIEIPTFTGKYTSWPTFHDLYTEAIHKNKHLTKCQKMQHLKGRLRGEAERLIQHLHIASDNYDTAWELLTRRYNNPQLLFTNQIESFLNQPNVQKQSAFELKRLYDTSMECIHAIQNLGVDTSTWDPLLVHLISKKLDVETLVDYKEIRKCPRDLPVLSELMSFLEDKFIALEPIQKKEKVFNKPNHASSQRCGNNPNHACQAATTSSWTCPLCKQQHQLYKCKTFIKLSPEKRLEKVNKLQYCKNCLHKHSSTSCSSTRTCKQCQQEHHTMLHVAIGDGAGQKNVTATTSSENNKISNEKQLRVNHLSSSKEETLLTTLLIKIKAADGTFVKLRALLDQGSQVSLISENAAQLLLLPRKRSSATVSGIGNGAKSGKGIVTLECQSIHDDFSFQTDALILKNVVNNLPQSTFKKQSWSHLYHLKLADPEYNVSKPIDLLLDADVYSNIIMAGLIKGPPKAPIAQQTKMGWILSGNVKTFNCNVVINDLSDISKYWESEEINDNNVCLTPGELFCENLYQTTTKRLDNGRYQVSLPMKPGYEKLIGESKQKAIAQFYNLEKRLLKNEKLNSSYIQFMNDYEQQGHMITVPVNQPTHITCYLPHHGVLKSDINSTKLRTVFNASSRNSTGRSLNDLMEQGPNLQKDLHSLLLVWRQHKYVITADIEQMFRQIFIRPEDQPLQRIIWRNSPLDALQEFQLTTVSYGTRAAPYLALRTLKQLAIDERENYPLASAALESSFYMDDLLEGGNSIEHVKELQGQIINALKGAGMNIRKWSSNSKKLTELLPTDKLDSSLIFKCSENRKTLGLQWNSSSDSFIFENKFKDESNESEHEKITKRQLLSCISTIFDPLGWLSPLTIRAKLLFQQTWSLESTVWDSPLPEDIRQKWNQLKTDYQNIDQFEIPRYLGDVYNNYQVHGFCDASEKAYACAIYLVSTNSKGERTSKIITAKTKLAPLHNKLSLPRLELCGAVLLSRLMNKVQDALTTPALIFAWTDSMVVLGWIHGDINRWKTFVAHRVQSITSIIPSSQWHHVKSEENSADCATRGLSSLQLSSHSLWWEGPRWLSSFDSNHLKNNKYQPPTIETKTFSGITTLSQDNNFIIKLLHECNSIHRIATTIAWLYRYVTWLNNKQKVQGCITRIELEKSHCLIIKTVQNMAFSEDINNLRKKTSIGRNSKILCLDPFLDSDGLLKVGGRLNHSHLSQAAKHPVILPSHDRLTELVIQQAHATTLHGGPSLALSYLRQRYWIISGLRTVKREIRKCVKCRRYNALKQNPMMADLPQSRVTPSRPFTHTGVDFTGYFDIKLNKGRGVRTNKGYVAVFICLATKAVHLELVSDLSTPGFLSAFRRFCARRGTPSDMYSDNGTNFVGANKLLQLEYQSILTSISENIPYQINDCNIEWHFNAPAYPSAGGLWEAAVKSFKKHLRRVLGEQKLAYEEFITLLHQIEACMNSRPLCKLSEDQDCEFLSPGHFLIGDSLLSRPQSEPGNIPLTTRWQLIQTMNKSFWKKWSSDYLQQLQVRSKWKTPTSNTQIGDLVLIRDENLPPGKWAMGKIIMVHPGKDGVVRVVSIKTQNGVLQRPVLKLIRLLSNVEETQPLPSPVDTSQESTSANTNNNHQPTRRLKRGITSTFSQILYAASVIFMLFLVTPGQCSYNVSNFKSNQNIYFDKRFDLNIVRDEWKLIIYSNMSTYWSTLNHVTKYVEVLRQQVNNTESSLQYHSIIYQLEHELSEINHYNQILKQPIGQPRQKRGLVNGIGYMANSLFGILDDRFAKQYEEDIQRISMNEDHLRLLLRNQTSIIESQSNILRRNENIMNKQFGIIQQHLEEENKEIKLVRQENDHRTYMLSSALSAMIIISNLKSMQNSLIDCITDLSHGRINVHFLPPTQFETQLNIIYSNLQGDLTLPAEKNNIQELYKLIKADVKVGSSYFIIEAKIPLISSTSFELDRIFSLPHQDYEIEVIAPYIAFNLQKDLFITLSEADIQDCVHRSNNDILCSINQPIYSIPMSHSICNANLHNKTICYTKKTTCRDRWIQLHKNNRWLFSCCSKCVIRIFCPNTEMKLETLIGNGLLDIEQGYTLKSDSFSIHGSMNYVSRVDVQNVEPISPTLSILNHVWDTSRLEAFAPEDHAEEWLTMKKQIENIKIQSDSPISIHDVHQYTVLYITLGLLLSAVSAYCILRQNAKRRNQNTHPDTTTSLELKTFSPLPETTVRENTTEVTLDPTSTTRATMPRTTRLTIPRRYREEDVILPVGPFSGQDVRATYNNK